MTAITWGDPRVPSRVWSKLASEPSTGCWLWLATVNHHGYGSTAAGVKGRTALVHRFVFEHLVGPIPAGFQLDHLCRNRSCANPLHLEPVSPKENTRRGLTGQRTRERILSRTHCPKGHPYDGDNLHVRPMGWRDCRACHRDRERARYRASRDQPVRPVTCGRCGGSGHYARSCLAREQETA